MVRMARIAASLALAGGIALPIGAVAAQGTAPTVIVAPFNVHAARGDSRDFAGVGTAIADLLSADLRAGGARVVDRGPAQRTLALQPRTRDGMLGRDGAVAAARVLGAAHAVYGGFTADAAGNVRLDARAVNVSSGAVEFTERLQGHGDDVVAMLQQLASRLATGMSMPLSGAAPHGVSLPLRSLVDYGKGLEAVDRGDRVQARRILEGVVREHPGFAPARAALAAAGDR
jgi:TolB-like protein